MIGLLQKLQSTLDQKSLAPFGSKLILCVSGGSDSMALLHLFQRLSSLYRWQLNILHFHHGIRRESDEEATWVRNITQSLGHAFYLKKTRVFQAEKAGFQEKARGWRRSEALKLNDEIGTNFIATAHHADDQIETWLLKWLRGAHLSGLQGMSISDPPFIRPLLEFSKDELLDFLKEEGLEWREDTSNQDSKYLRNRVRNELIPMLQELSRDGIKTRIQNLDEQSRLLEKDLEERFENWILNLENDSEIPILFMQKEPEFLQREILIRFIRKKTGMALSYRKLEKIFRLTRGASSSWTYNLESQWIVFCMNNKLFCELKVDD